MNFCRYFAQIDEDLLIELLDIYGPDFDLFGYNSTKYFGIVQPSKVTYRYSSPTSVEPKHPSTVSI